MNERHIDTLVNTLDAMAAGKLPDGISQSLRAARRLAVARVGARTEYLSGHWINWAPAALMLVLALSGIWAYVGDSQQSLDAELLADALPIDAFLDVGFETAVDPHAVRLIDD